MLFRPLTRLFVLALLLAGDFYTGSVLAATLTKLVLRYSQISTDKKRVNSLRAEAMLIMTSVVRVGQSKFAVVPIDEDSQERILNCVQTLSEFKDEVVVTDMFLKDTKAAYAIMAATEEVCVFLDLLVNDPDTPDAEKGRREV